MSRSSSFCGQSTVLLQYDSRGSWPMLLLCSAQTCNPNWNRRCSTHVNSTIDISLKSRARSEGDAAFESMLDPVEGSPATDKSVAGIMNLFVDDLFGTGGTEMEQRVVARLKKDFQVGSEDCNDVLFTRQSIRCTTDPQLGPSIEVNQEWATEDLEEIPVEKNIKEDLHCTPAMHANSRSLLGQINWLPSRSQLQGCYKFSKCASKAASPAVVDVKPLSKLSRQLKSQPVELQCLPRTGPLRISGFPDASYRTKKMGLHSEAWQFFKQTCKSIL